MDSIYSLQLLHGTQCAHAGNTGEAVPSHGGGFSVRVGKIPGFMRYLEKKVLTG